MPQSEVVFRVSSPAFDEGAAIPARLTADGADVSPELWIENVPEGTVSLALIMDDPDAPMGTWVHWVVWNLPGDTAVIPEGTLPAGAVTGRNSWGRMRYGGPSPPSGTHRYFFKVFALDTRLDLASDADKAMLEKAIEGRVLGKAVLMGRYSRP